MLTYLYKKYFTRLESDSIYAAIHTASSLVLFSLWFALQSSYRMQAAIQFGVLFALLAIFHMARRIFGWRPTEPFPFSADRERQIQYIHTGLWAALAVFLLYRGILFALHDHPAGSAIRLLVAGVAGCFAVNKYWKAKNDA